MCVKDVSMCLFRATATDNVFKSFSFSLLYAGRSLIRILPATNTIVCFYLQNKYKEEKIGSQIFWCVLFYFHPFRFPGFPSHEIEYVGDGCWMFYFCAICGSYPVHYLKVTSLNILCLCYSFNIEFSILM